MKDTAFRVAALFSDDMVLQRDKPLPVWGTGRDGMRVTVVFGEARAETVVKKGVWLAVLPPVPAGRTGCLEVMSEGAALCFTNVVSGDVWFAGGQSNMELELQNGKDGKAELAASANPGIRFYPMVKRAVVDEAYLRAEAETSWQVCGPDTAAPLSAVAYFFAREVNRETGVPIGIISCSWGGTSVSAWMSEEQLCRTRAGARYVAEYAALVAGKSDAQYQAEMGAYFRDWKAWDSRVRARREKDPAVTWETLNRECGECPWPQPAGSTSPYRPANLYHAMVRRALPFALAGFLYYQGEEDGPRAADYGEMMCYLIDQWRTDWGDDTLPFLFVQLPMYASRADLAEGLTVMDWPLLRENQWRVSRRIAHTGLAVTIDCGEFDNIHPLDKQTVGHRLALQALQKVYGKPVAADGPQFLRIEPAAGDGLRIWFTGAETGLEWRGDPAGFEIAGEDGVYHAAEAEIDGSTVVIRSEKVEAPEQCRYAWIKWGPTPLYAKNGLPAMPFRHLPWRPLGGLWGNDYRGPILGQKASRLDCFVGKPPRNDG
ncbi:MAG: sialate O-acetylesterase [Spirochaetaceae bacterium]|jgi:sialate O-acetylesterase|nr:sialate O-acetylesterase [Spirochaetaceae bacterium]